MLPVKIQSVNLTSSRWLATNSNALFLPKEKCSPKFNSLFVIDLIQIVELMIHLSYSNLYQKYTSKTQQSLKRPDLNLSFYECGSIRFRLYNNTAKKHDESCSIKHIIENW